MKKTYIAPEIEAIEVEAVNLIALSNGDNEIDVNDRSDFF